MQLTIKPVTSGTRENSAWANIILGDCISLKRGHDLTWRDRRSGGIPVMGSAGLAGYHDAALVRGPGVVLGRSGASFGQAHYCESDFWPHNTALYVTDFRQNDPRFVFYLLSAIDFSRHNSGGAQQSLNRNFIAPIAVALPQPSEQRLIAQALDDVDALLDALDRLIAKKRDLKQAAMQQLLTGQTRLPGFSGDWDEFLVEDVVVGFFCGPSPTCEERNIGDQFEWGVLKTTAATVDAGWNWRAHKVLPQAFWHQHHIELRKGDVIVTKAGPRHRVGVAVWIDFVPPRIVPSGKMIALRPDPKRAVPLLLASAISAPAAQTFLDQRTTGMAESQVNFENGVLLKTPIRLPNIEEQAAIATVLSDLDAELEALEQRRAKTAALQQGMMQELLTGRTRLA
jgi:type I restriction enzyme, S subunit